MSAGTSIEWATATWQVTAGCSKVSEGCRNCYAEKFARRLAAMGRADYRGIHRGGAWNGELKTLPHKLDEPSKWRTSQWVFVDSMSDLFHPKVPYHYLDKVFESFQKWNWHVYLVLTKRPERARAYLSSRATKFAQFKNVFLGTSVENSEAYKSRVHHLLMTPHVGGRFLSCEPLLDRVDVYYHENHLFKLDWVIAGGESGPGARCLWPAWVRSLRDQCVRGGVKFFFKQWGQHVPWENHLSPDGRRYTGDKTGVKTAELFWTRSRSKKESGRTLDGRTWDERPDWPAGVLRVEATK